MNKRCDIAIVGGGLNGLTTALALAQAGFDVVVVERADPAKQREDSFDGRVSSIAYSSKLVLDALGAWEAMTAHAEPILEIRVSDGDAPLFLHYDHADLGDEPLGWILENRYIRRALDAALATTPGVRVLAPAEVAGMTRDSDGVTLTMTDGAALDAKLAVACDGAMSPLRAIARIGHFYHAYGQSGIVCNVRHERRHRGIAHERFLPSGPFAILPVPGNMASLVWTEKDDIARRVVELDRVDILEEINWRFGDFLGDLELAGPVWSYPLRLVLADRYTDSRLALLGDAAHAIHPIAGQGYNLGIRDVAVLAEVLADGRKLGLEPGDASLLERYARWRRTDMMTLVSVCDSLNCLFSNAIPPVVLARDLGLAAVNQIPPLKRLLMRHAMGTVGKLPRLMRGEEL
ncbi:MAG: UbiH/UbiF/VisC/COQ6 family ubiquinone biosynthesis hydroxylase [Alphaproteobacteria bacterium]|jgi:2-octaprenyl-6-methoxyphenol hydroxylase|nr:UbiH/UbiF/VisC/COQ6 family ubiquinone biosynthesis hydroxylase [Rhodospirillaceae bacterium]MDG2480996.1 UbiH/UbiF/VisC/COQ6 family ubiquinone biosynthesis hydroxylase [Alphaproteobacteria bacterium]MBT6206003.1 UbiH/UbiF/VisC/COQ6 family ubiquinone biosynthesis hydroxylase [Rhodospirillaceae bacterium]MBT6510960.1 UbiH/UbiF/VisC/COQ6 family ubiquinone biosynthesis hydroxylase [Rhodospirillaceae bacterium]MBT7614322.1 UbiH/UbiF/VisC/COQ6 family ubiquinone biosynthesis hydroxylase [Rhodospiri